MILKGEHKKFNIKDFKNGWFVGNFIPSLIKTNDVEIGLKEYKAGDYESFHHHRKATEITCIVEGEVEMCGVRYKSGDILVIKPFQGTDFKAITDAKNIVVKYPGANNDKFEGQYETDST
jgi:ethanolamine utilization protein EutQ (cupin superfamily)